MPENPYKNLPSFLYKYRYFDDKGFHLQPLKGGKLYCSSPLNFNDPFDCVVRIDYSSPSDDDLLKKFIRLEKHLHPNWKELSVIEEARSKVSKFDRDALENKDLIKTRILNHVNNFIGVFALSAEKNNILLWSHYSNSHKGFLVEFDAIKLKNFLINTYTRPNKIRLLQEVKYSNKYKLINSYAADYNEELNKALLTKSNIWAYEREWRILFYGGVNTFIEIPNNILSEIITCVILGSKVDAINEDRMKSILKNINIPMQKAVQSEDKFVLIYKDLK